MYKIGEISEIFGISRSTLLYYDKVGLLSPSYRTRSNYRVYSENDLERMKKIETYKKAGVPLKDIKDILESGENILVSALEKRLSALNMEISTLKGQQKQITELLSKTSGAAEIKALDKDGWISILRASGMDDNDLFRWHIEFEKVSPDAHQNFLEFLGMKSQEIRAIRQASKQSE